MSIDIRKKTETAYHPVFWEILSDIQSGVTIATGALKTTTKTLAKGALLGESEDTDGIYYLCKSAEVYADSSITTVTVLLNHEFKAGDYITNGVKSTLIASITTGTTYDSIVGTAAMSVSDGDIIYEGTAEGLSDDDVAQKYAPKGILRNTLQVLEYDEEGCLTTLDNVTGGVVTRGTVNESGMPYPPAAVQKTSLTDRIRFA